ncbi:MAG: hypothetical protein HY901_24175, partial [Deltaproteobacteria bacterium]|nr:hypothetical protein [Deltaproteobacteria bacterium]
MRKLLSSFLLLALVGLGACSIDSSGEPVAKDPFVPTQGPAPYKPTPAPPTNKRVVLLHTNDEHSHLLGYAPFSEYPFLPEADGTV